jgi:hypothetical protein
MQNPSGTHSVALLGREAWAAGAAAGGGLLQHVHGRITDSRLLRSKRRGRSPSFASRMRMCVQLCPCGAGRPRLRARTHAAAARRPDALCTRGASAQGHAGTQRRMPIIFPVPLHTSVALESALGMWSPVARCLRAAYVHGRSSSGGLFTGCVLPSLPVTGFLTPHFNTHDWPLAARHACTRQLLTIFSVRLLCMPFSHACRL